jgi:hypothetical protein
MAYLTTNQLLEYRRQPGIHTFANIRESRVGAQLTIFLSHSHLDRNLVEGLIGLLDSLGITIYVDWNDNNMPRITNRETAEKIKQKIRENTLFAILATPNALASKWVPWETGIGDQAKGQEAILLIPVADPNGQFPGSEYLQLYNRFEFRPLGYQYPVPSLFRILSPDGRDLHSLQDHLRAGAQ